MRPRVFLVDDHELFRSGVRAELGDAVDVVGEASDVDAAVEMILERRPEVVLLDVHLPDGGGRAVVQRVAPHAPEVRFLALSVSDAAEDVIGVIRAGARGYVTKTISGPELADAIRRVADGDVVFSRRLAGFVLDAFAASPGPSADPELDQLTAREQEVLRLIALGQRNTEIAAALHLSVKTVEIYVSRVLAKLGVRTRTEAASTAYQHGLVMLGDDSAGGMELGF